MWRRKTGAKAGRGEMRCCDVRGCKVRGRKPASEMPFATRPGYHRGCRGTNEKNRRDANSGLRHNAKLQSRRAPLCRRWPALITYASVLLGLTWAGLAPLIAPALPGAFLHSDRPSVRASWRARHGRSSGDQTAELKNSKSAKCRALRHKLESPSSLYARRHSRDSGIATTRPLIGDSIMTVLLKYLAVLGFAGALSLATTTAFAQNVSGGENSNGAYYC
jgi:hypothetical protein